MDSLLQWCESKQQPKNITSSKCDRITFCLHQSSSPPSPPDESRLDIFSAAQQTQPVQEHMHLDIKRETAENIRMLSVFSLRRICAGAAITGAARDAKRETKQWSHTQWGVLRCSTTEDAIILSQGIKKGAHWDRPNSFLCSHVPLNNTAPPHKCVQFPVVGTCELFECFHSVHSTARQRGKPTVAPHIGCFRNIVPTWSKNPNEWITSIFKTIYFKYNWDIGEMLEESRGSR